MRWLKVSVAAGLLAACVHGPGRAAAEAPGRWFIQVWFDEGLPALADPNEDPGRVEVTIDDAFVGCALAAYSRPSAQEIRLVPISLGFAATGRREGIKVEVHGQLRRLAKPRIKISEMPSVPVAVPTR